jgi:hypothetical protein
MDHAYSKEICPSIPIGKGASTYSCSSQVYFHLGSLKKGSRTCEVDTYGLLFDWCLVKRKLTELAFVQQAWCTYTNAWHLQPGLLHAYAFLLNDLATSN